MRISSSFTDYYDYACAVFGACGTVYERDRTPALRKLYLDHGIPKARWLRDGPFSYVRSYCAAVIAGWPVIIERQDRLPMGFEARFSRDDHRLAPEAFAWRIATPTRARLFNRRTGILDESQRAGYVRLAVALQLPIFLAHPNGNLSVDIGELVPRLASIDGMEDLFPALELYRDIVFFLANCQNDEAYPEDPETLDPAERERIIARGLDRASVNPVVWRKSQEF